jgi:predicted acylesterase/phospholipase RssA
MEETATDAIADRLRGVRYLTFSSSGRAGISYHGVLLAAEALFPDAFADMLRGVRGVCGTSGGSLFALALALGIPASQRVAIVSDFVSVLTQPTECPNLSLLFHARGLDDGAAFRDRVGGLLAAGGLSPAVTLGDLDRLLRIRVVFVAHDLVSNEPVHLSAETHPSMAVRDAAMASCCIPILFTPVRHEGLVLVDGAMSEAWPCPFPPEETFAVVVDLPLRATDDVSSWTSFLRAIFTSSLAAQKRAYSKRAAKRTAILVNITDAFLIDVNDLSCPLSAATLQQTVAAGWSTCVCALRPDAPEAFGRQAVRLAQIRGRVAAPPEGDDDEDGRCNE